MEELLRDILIELKAIRVRLDSKDILSEEDRLKLKQLVASLDY